MMGEQGLVGAQGNQGFVGNQGNQGLVGAQGTHGTAGTQGARGNQGVQGLYGTQGAEGNQGLTGTQGSGSRWKCIPEIFTGIIIVVDTVTSMPSFVETVDIGTAGNYTMLAKTGMTTAGATNIVGDIATYPIASGALTGFALFTDPSNEFFTSSLVDGKIYTADRLEPTPSLLIAAVQDMEAAFLDATNRSATTSPDSGGGAISGMTFDPGVHKWSSGVGFSSNITFNGTPDDVFILQIAGALTVTTGATVTLTGGAQSSNIFWAVSDAVTLTGADMVGIILGATSMSFEVGCSLVGRALVQTAITMISNTIMPPSTNPLSASPPGTFHGELGLTIDGGIMYTWNTVEWYLMPDPPAFPHYFRDDSDIYSVDGVTLPVPSLQAACDLRAGDKVLDSAMGEMWELGVDGFWELTCVLRNASVNSVQNANATDVLTNNSSLLVEMDDMVHVAPEAGTYMVIFSAQLKNSMSGGIVHFSLINGNVAERRCEGTDDTPCALTELIVVDGTENIQILWRHSGDGTGTAAERTLQIMLM
jgi:hypothetical protein